MTRQSVEEEERQAWANSALLDSVGRSTKPFGRRDLAQTGFVSTAGSVYSELRHLN